MEIGQRLKELRLTNGLTLEELAARSELTKGFLSQLERDLTSPSLSTLEDILEALGTNLSEFFAPEKDEQLVFTPEDYFVNEQADYKMTWIVPNAQKNEMEPVLLDLYEGASYTQPSFAGQALGYVLKGRVRLVVGPKTIDLKKGETFYVNGRHAHRLEALKTCQILWVSNPPAF